MDSQDQLEQRVKTLEYEIKVLKNEIQRTLLDIQEQILIHYYPALRADPDNPEEGVAQAFETLQRKRRLDGRVDSPSMARQPAPIATRNAPRGQSNSAIKQVSLQEFTVPQGRSRAPGEPSREEVVALSGWVTKLVMKVGQSRASDLVEAAAAKGWLSPDVAAVMHRVVGLVDAENVPLTVTANEVLDPVLELSKLVGRGGQVDDALNLIEEADLG